MKPEPLVNIVMVTYNHEKYISQAIESVLMQNCSFKFQLIIGEDSSTDRTREICERYRDIYPEKIILMERKKNMGMAANYGQVFNVCTGKYIAILEGDDFYTDSNKLTKQIGILESNPEFGVIHSNYLVLYENKKVKVGHALLKKKMLHGELYNSLALKNTICPATTCFRRELFEQHVDFKFAVENSLQTIDLFIWLELSYHTKVFYLEDITSCWRVINTSISNNKDIERYNNFVNCSALILEYYFNKYSFNNNDLRNPIGIIYKDLILRYIEINNYEKAREYINKLDFTNSNFWWIWLLSHYKILNPLHKGIKNFKLFASHIKQSLIKKLFNHNSKDITFCFFIIVNIL
jgi:glycosyltransferase involved in cell wall biosynthesis